MHKQGGKYFAWNPLTGQRDATGCRDRKAAQLVVAGWERQRADPAWHDASAKTLADLRLLVSGENIRPIVCEFIERLLCETHRQPEVWTPARTDALFEAIDLTLAGYPVQILQNTERPSRMCVRVGDEG